jgi:hypothetical protein
MSHPPIADFPANPTAHAAALPLASVIIPHLHTRSRPGPLEDVGVSKKPGRTNSKALFQKLNGLFQPVVISSKALKLGGIQKKGTAQVVAPAPSSTNGHDHAEARKVVAPAPSSSNGHDNAEARKLRSGSTQAVLTGSDQPRVIHDPDSVAAVPEPVHAGQDATNPEGANVFYFLLGGGVGARMRGRVWICLKHYPQLL